MVNNPGLVRAIPGDPVSQESEWTDTPGAKAFQIEPPWGREQTPEAQEGRA